MLDGYHNANRRKTSNLITAVIASLRPRWPDFASLQYHPLLPHLPDERHDTGGVPKNQACDPAHPYAIFAEFPHAVINL